MKDPKSVWNQPKAHSAFSLVELLTVMAIIVILATLAIPVLSRTGQDMNTAADSLSDVLQQARTWAMSKNTYVYVGLSTTSGIRPELAVSVLEARNGISSASNDLATVGTDLLQPIVRAKFYEGVTVDTNEAETNLPATSLPTSASSQVEKIEVNSLISFPSTWVTQRGDISENAFTWVVQFSPDGAARIDATRRTVPGYIQIGLIPAQGESDNSATLLIDGPSGAVRVLRPGV